MMGEIAKLTAGSNGALDPADYQRTVETLMKGGSDPVITSAPVGPGRTRSRIRRCRQYKTLHPAIKLRRVQTTT